MPHGHIPSAQVHAVQGRLVLLQKDCQRLNWKVAQVVLSLYDQSGHRIAPPVPDVLPELRHYTRDVQPDGMFQV